MPNEGFVITSPDITEVIRCRACGGSDLIPYLDLGEQALANAFLTKEDLLRDEFKAPLGVQWCPECGLSQLTHVVSPERLYSTYLYASGANPAWAAHQQALVDAVTALRPEKQFVVEIASNDGTLLERFQAAGHGVLGVEPAKNLVDCSTVPTVHRFWSPAVAEGIVQFHELADVVVAQNVFGHVDDTRSFLQAVARILADEGVCLIECPHILALLDQNAVDTIYHEHLSYWGLRSLLYAVAGTGLSVTHVEAFPDLHGGTMRYYLQLGDRPMSRAAQNLLEREENVYRLGVGPYLNFGRRARDIIRRFREWVTDIPDEQRVVGYGASAKGNVLLQAADVNLDYLVDDSPLKAGRYSPGLHIPVVETFQSPLPDVCVLLAWNWAEELKTQATAKGFRGRFLLPLPEPHYE